ncbi:MAG: hypothetical protein ACJ72E_15175, partial [Marmoricola sp.]
MRSPSRLTLALLLVAPLLVIGLAVPSAQARAGVPTVSGVTLIGQDWYGSRLRVKWRAVAGATY